MEASFFETMKIVLVRLSPLILVIGMFLVLVKQEKIVKLEKKLDKEMGLKVRLVPPIEKNIFTFHNWLAKRTFVIGLFLMAVSIFIFATLS